MKSSRFSTDDLVAAAAEVERHREADRAGADDDDAGAVGGVAGAGVAPISL